MIDTGKCGSDITGVNCDATNCRFNTTDRKCSADSIKVKNERAVTKGETYCETFAQRGGSD